MKKLIALLFAAFQAYAADVTLVWDYPCPADEADRFRIVATRTNGEIVQKDVPWDKVTTNGITTKITLRGGTWVFQAFAVSDSTGLISDGSNTVTNKVAPKAVINLR